MIKYYRNRKTLIFLSPKKASIQKAFAVFEKDLATVISKVDISYSRAQGKDVKTKQEIISWLSRIETKAALFRGRIEVATAGI